MVGRNPSHTREVAATPTDPQTVWITELDQGRATGTPAVVDGRLYVSVDAISDTARHRHRIHALTAATGEERWQVPLRSEPNGPPAVSGDRIVVTARRSLEQGRIVCFQTRYGEEDWLVDIDARLTAPPTIDGGVVYIPDWRGQVHALSVSDGSVLWSRHVDADGSGRTFPESVAVLEETLYIGSQSGKTGVVALDATTGERRWTESTHAVTGGPVAHGNGIIVQSHQLVIAFDTDGSRRWSFNVLEGTARPIAVDDRHVYVAARNALYAINWNGKEAWVYESSGERIGTPTIAGETVLVRGEDHLTALSRVDGTKQWTATPKGVGRAVVVPEAIFLSGADGTVIALGEA
ncbi:outer membrane protein assembly factor BamB family protein [Halorussus salinisoli]|uniref:outer membrane protein assembly factor BamB family protein n=1 Tax=Halorussus salinisoli TaxID=2558242 RepID=UPI0010C1E61F|nr:PQQ-binding-like beta-propeller repeat protein [Halorussus salinisoli]